MPNFTPHQAWLQSQADSNQTNSPVDFDTDDIRVALITSAVTPNPASHGIWGDLIANEVSGAGYTAGGHVLTAKTVTNNAGVIEFDAADASWAQNAGGFSNARHAILLKYDTGTPNDSIIVGSSDLGSDKGNVNGPLSFEWASDGLLKWSVL